MFKKVLLTLTLPCLLTGTISPIPKPYYNLLEPKKVPASLAETVLPQVPTPTLTSNFGKSLDPRSSNGVQKLWDKVNTLRPEYGTEIAKATVSITALGLTCALYKMSQYCKKHKHTKSEKLFKWGSAIAALATTIVTFNYYYV